MQLVSVFVLLISLYIAAAAAFSNANIAAISKRKTTGGIRASDDDLDEVTKKYGLEYGIFKSFNSPNNKVKPQELLAKYGAAYLATSISLAVVSYAICFTLVSNGIDVAALLSRVGIQVTDASSTAGVAGIAYIFHKAASPIRFPPTVALTPIVANWIGKKPVEETE